MHASWLAHNLTSRLWCLRFINTLCCPAVVLTCYRQAMRQGLLHKRLANKGLVVDMRLLNTVRDEGTAAQLSHSSSLVAALINIVSVMHSTTTSTHPKPRQHCHSTCLAHAAKRGIGCWHLAKHVQVCNRNKPDCVSDHGKHARCVCVCCVLLPAPYVCWADRCSCRLPTACCTSTNTGSFTVT